MSERGQKINTDDMSTDEFEPPEGPELIGSTPSNNPPRSRAGSHMRRLFTSPEPDSSESEVEEVKDSSPRCVWLTNPRVNRFLAPGQSSFKPIKASSENSNKEAPVQVHKPLPIRSSNGCKDKPGSGFNKENPEAGLDTEPSTSSGRRGPNTSLIFPRLITNDVETQTGDFVVTKSLINAETQVSQCDFDSVTFLQKVAGLNTTRRIDKPVSPAASSDDSTTALDSMSPRSLSGFEFYFRFKTFPKDEKDETPRRMSPELEKAPIILNDFVATTATTIKGSVHRGPKPSSNLVSSIFVEDGPASIGSNQRTPPTMTYPVPKKRRIEKSEASGSGAGGRGAVGGNAEGGGGAGGISAEGSRFRALMLGGQSSGVIGVRDGEVRRTRGFIWMESNPECLGARGRCPKGIVWLENGGDGGSRAFRFGGSAAGSGGPKGGDPGGSGAEGRRPKGYIWIKKHSGGGPLPGSFSFAGIIVGGSGAEGNDAEGNSARGRLPRTLIWIKKDTGAGGNGAGDSGAEGHVPEGGNSLVPKDGGPGPGGTGPRGFSFRGYSFGGTISAWIKIETVSGGPAGEGHGGNGAGNSGAGGHVPEIENSGVSKDGGPGSGRRDGGPVGEGLGGNSAGHSGAGGHVPEGENSGIPNDGGRGPRGGSPVGEGLGGNSAGPSGAGGHVPERENPGVPNDGGPGPGGTGPKGFSFGGSNPGDNGPAGFIFEDSNPERHDPADFGVTPGIARPCRNPICPNRYDSDEELSV